MRTLMYLMDSLDTARAMAASLNELAVRADGYHVLSKDEDGLRRHRLHSASPLEQSDLIHSGERGALFGAMAGVLFALGLVIWQPLGIPMGWTGFFVAAIFIGCFGAWVGGLVGISHENYKLAPFHKAIADGKYLMVINLREGHRAEELKRLLHERHPEVRFAAEDSSGIDPFASKAEFRVRKAY